MFTEDSFLGEQPEFTPIVAQYIQNKLRELTQDETIEASVIPMSRRGEGGPQIFVDTALSTDPDFRVKFGKLIPVPTVEVHGTQIACPKAIDFLDFNDQALPDRRVFPVYVPDPIHAHILLKTLDPKGLEQAAKDVEQNQNLER